MSGIRDRITELRRVRAGDLHASPKNWRTHPESQVAALRGTLAEIGYADAVLCRVLDDGSLEIIDGHARKELDPDQVIPCLVTDLSEPEAAKLLLTLDPLAAMAEADTKALERLMQEVDTDSEALQAMIDALAAEHGIGIDETPPAPDPQPDRAAELQAQWNTAAGQVWRIPGKGGTHRVLCGDSTKAEDVARLMAGKKVSLVVTDPPYGVSYGDKNKFLNAISRGNRIQTPIENDHGDKGAIQDVWLTAFTNAKAAMLPARAGIASCPRAVTR